MDFLCNLSVWSLDPLFIFSQDVIRKYARFQMQVKAMTEAKSFTFKLRTKFCNMPMILRHSVCLHDLTEGKLVLIIGMRKRKPTAWCNLKTTLKNAGCTFITFIAYQKCIKVATNSASKAIVCLMQQCSISIEEVMLLSLVSVVHVKFGRGCEKHLLVGRKGNI